METMENKLKLLVCEANGKKVKKQQVEQRRKSQSK